MRVEDFESSTRNGGRGGLSWGVGGEAALHWTGAYLLADTSAGGTVLVIGKVPADRSAEKSYCALYPYDPCTCEKRLSSS